MWQVYLKHEEDGVWILLSNGHPDHKEGELTTPHLPNARDLFEHLSKYPDQAKVLAPLIEAALDDAFKHGLKAGALFRDELQQRTGETDTVELVPHIRAIVDKMWLHKKTPHKW